MPFEEQVDSVSLLWHMVDLAGLDAEMGKESRMRRMMLLTAVCVAIWAVSCGLQASDLDRSLQPLQDATPMLAQADAAPVAPLPPAASTTVRPEARPRGSLVKTARERLQAGTGPFALPSPGVALKPPLEAACCTGPTPCVSQYLYGKHYSGGFLYYGTSPYDDDWFNNFSGCCRDYPGCAQTSTTLGRWWVNFHNACHGPAYTVGHDPTALHGKN